jgi:CRP/FNR family transcriptional regulator, nitrogen oxide reductase regulator
MRVFAIYNLTIIHLECNSPGIIVLCDGTRCMTSQPIASSTLAQIGMLADLPPALAESLVRNSRLRQIPRGEILFAQGDDARTIFGVVSGRLRLMQHTLDGQDVAMSVFAPGDLIGLVAVIGNEEYPGTCEASDDSALLAIPGSTFFAMMEAHAPLAIQAVKLLVHRVHEAHDHIRELSAERVERRLARTVLRLVNKVGVKSEHGIRIDMPLSRQDLAELTGTTLYTVSRILGEWQRAGLVDIGREEVILIRPHDLVMIAEDMANKST